MRHFRIAIIGVTIALAGVFLGLSWQNSQVLRSVSIRIKDGVQEKTDHTLLGIGAEHRLPDYKITLNVMRRLLPVDLGTKLNTSATNWLEFPVNATIPLRQLQEVIIIEDDKVENDVLERIQIIQAEMEGKSFHCRMRATRSLEAGMNWFFATSPGRAIAIGIVVGCILLVTQLFRR